MARFDSVEYTQHLGTSAFNNGHGLMAFLASYMDESGTHGNAKVCIISGFVASDKQWINFAKEWNTALRKEGIGHLHVTDFLAAQENTEFAKFKDWTSAEKAGVLFRLASVIPARVRAIVGEGVDVEEFQSIVKEYNAERLFPSPYTYCAFSAVFDLSNWANESNARETVSVWFERGNRRSGEAQRLLNTVLQARWGKDRFKIGSIATDTKENVIQFQPCDLASHRLYTFHTDRLSAIPPQYDRVFEPLSKIKPIGVFHGTERIVAIIKILQEHMPELADFIL